MDNITLSMTILGSGTSQGIPQPGCNCAVCNSDDYRDNRTRASAWIQTNESSILIDPGPEFRIQAIRAGIQKLDAVLVTHVHADHIHGIDDLRPFSSPLKPLPMYATHEMNHEIRERFPYIFKETIQEGGGKPNIFLYNIEGFTPFNIGDCSVFPIPGYHGKLEIMGYRFDKIAYLTDISSLPDLSIKALLGLDVLVLNGLRIQPHATHLSFDEAIDLAKTIGAKKTWITHICHEMCHAQIIDYFRQKTQGRVEPAFDGLIISE